ncbi:MAG: hypothetical protein RLY47_480 [Candidatus Parcubacteria bacterium]|jgi:prolyl-tRNA synthetase
MTVTKQSHLFTKTRREAPADETAKNAQLLIRGGFVHKEMAGVYDLLPLGVRVLNKINGIIREEMNAVGGQEVHLSALQNPETWKTTNRWDDEVVDNWFKTELKAGGMLGLGFTHEEPLTELMKNHISSYRDLPRAVYQIQTKFRNELRAKSGIMRGREFLMKDMYSFSSNEAEHLAFYEKAKEAYFNVFRRVGLGETTYLTFASGGSFSKFSHEFQTVTEAGEDTIYISKENKIAINKEVFTDEVKKDLGLGDDFIEAKAVEVGNIFTLATKFSDALGLTYKDETGEVKPVFMGSYGIGPTRLIGTIIETLADDKGIVWPKSVAPYDVHLVVIGSEKPDVAAQAEKIAADFSARGFDVLLDDRDARTGEKLGDADLIGIPMRVVISEKTMAEGKLEAKARTADTASFMSFDEVVEALKS